MNKVSLIRNSNPIHWLHFQLITKLSCTSHTNTTNIHKIYQPTCKVFSAIIYLTPRDWLKPTCSVTNSVILHNSITNLVILHTSVTNSVILHISITNYSHTSAPTSTWGSSNSLCINADNNSIVSGLISSDIFVIVNCIFKASKMILLRYLNVYLKTANSQSGWYCLLHWGGGKIHWSSEEKGGG